MKRRGFLAGILAASAAPAFVRAGILMPIRPIILPPFMSADSFLLDMERSITFGSGAFRPGDIFTVSGVAFNGKPKLWTVKSVSLGDTFIMEA